MSQNVVALPSDRQSAQSISQVTAVEQARAVAEVQAAVVVAQQCPRDMTRAEGEMRDVCGRLSLAERSFYRVPNRGAGPSVHLARELARIWGNLDYGVKELRRDDKAGESEILAYAWDVQTNTRSTRSFIVPHQRMVAGARKALVDLGDVYLNNQNIGARAVRECIFTVLPTWYVEDAQAIAQQTLRDGEGEPLPSRIDKMVNAFAATYGVKQGQLETRLGRKRGQWDAGDVAAMTITFRSIQRGEVTVSEEFPSTRVTAADVIRPADVPDPQNDAGAGAPAEVEAKSSPADGTETPAPASPLTAKTRGRMFALLAERGITDPVEQRAGMEQILGRYVTSRGSLTEEEAVQVCRHLVANVPVQPALTGDTE